MKVLARPPAEKTKLWSSNVTEVRDLAVAIQQQLKQASVDVEIETFEGPTLTNLLYKPPEENKMEMTISGWSPSTGDTDWALRPLLARSSWPTLFNTSFYDNPEVNDLIGRGLATADDATRKAAYAKVQQIVTQDAPWIFLYVARNFAGVRRDVGGMVVQADDVLAVQRAFYQA